MQCVRTGLNAGLSRSAHDSGAVGELLGGEDRIDPTLFESCGDSLIVNLGSEEWTEVSAMTYSSAERVTQFGENL